MPPPETRRPGAARIAAVAAALTLGIALGWQIVLTGVSQAFFNQGDLPAAYTMDRRDGILAGYLAVGLGRIGEQRAASAIARDALRHTPLASPAYGVLALASVTTDPALAAHLLGGATALGWRDPVVQTWAARLALVAGRIDEAAEHADAAARIGGTEDTVRPLLDTMAATPAPRAALVRRLLLAPDWRKPYFGGVILPLGDLAARGALLRAMTATPLPPTRDEIAMVVNLAGATMGLDRGYDLWRATAAPAIRGFVNDPDFTHVADTPFDDVPFAWLARTATGAEAEPDTLDGRPALHATSDGTAAGTLAMQVVKIPPGRHRFSVAAHFGSAGAGSAFRWSLVCSDGHVATDAIEPIAGSAIGSARFTFDIPATSRCPMQILSLAAEPAEMPGAVEAWFRDVQVGPPPGGSG